MIRWILNTMDKITTLLYSNITNSRKTFHELNEMSFKESAQFIYKNMSKAVLLENKKLFWEHALNKIPDTGLILEFGVFEGDSINFFSKIIKAKNDNRTLYGFDSFEGLSEDWSGTNNKQSTFDRKGVLPKVASNVKLVKGWLDATLPPFMEEHKSEGIAFMHLDMDTYTPTKIMLESCVDFLKEGSILVFDELLGYPGWKENEFKAFSEIIVPAWNYEFISYCEPNMGFRNKSKYVRVGLRILDRKNN